MSTSSELSPNTEHKKESLTDSRRSSVLELIKKSTQFKDNEKTQLETLIESESPELLHIIHNHTNDEQLQQELLKFVQNLKSSSAVAPMSIATDSNNTDAAISLSTSVTSSNTTYNSTPLPSPTNDTHATSTSSSPSPAVTIPVDTTKTTTTTTTDTTPVLPSSPSLTPAITTNTTMKTEEEDKQDTLKNKLVTAVKNFGGATPKADLIKSALRNVAKMFQTVNKNPEQIKNRRLRLNNILVKKFVIDVVGGIALFQAVGFQQVGQDEKEGVLEIAQDAVDNEMFRLVDDIINKRITELDESLKAPKVEKPRTLCKGGCGFYGDENTDFYCSKCHKEKVVGVKESKSSAPVQIRPCIKNCGFNGTEKTQWMCSLCHSKNKAATNQIKKKRLRMSMLKIRAMLAFLRGKKHAQQPKQINKTRCYQCSRKIGILGIECRCGFTFCTEHRYAKQHNCSFDHRKIHQDKLQKENPKFEDEKMGDKI